MEKRRLRGHRRRARSRLAHTAPRRPLRYRRLHSLLPGLRGFSRAARASYPARVPTPRGRPGLVPPVLVSLFVSVPRRSSAPRGRRRERALRVPARARCGHTPDAESARAVRRCHLRRRGRGDLRARSGGRRMPTSVLIFRRIHSGGLRTTWHMLPHRPMGHSPLSVTQRARISRYTRRQPPLPQRSSASTRSIPWVFPRRLLTVIFSRASTASCAST